MGIEDVYHLDYEYEKDTYNIEDSIKGRINFHMAKVAIKNLTIRLKRS